MRIPLRLWVPKAWNFPVKVLDKQAIMWYTIRMKNERKAFVFDLDGTLFETTAREREGTERFVEFSDAFALLTSSTPKPLLALARQVKAEGHKVYILTARNSIIAPAIRDLLSEHGVAASFVYCVGDLGGDIPAYKQEILAEIDRVHDRTYFYDDEEPNLILARKIGVKSYDACSYEDVPF